MLVRTRGTQHVSLRRRRISQGLLGSTKYSTGIPRSRNFPKIGELWVKVIQGPACCGFTMVFAGGTDQIVKSGTKEAAANFFMRITSYWSH